MEGGKILASGTYGCIFDPHYPCAPETQVPAGTKLISKVTGSQDGATEQHMWKRLSVIPEAQDYFVPIYSLCKPPPESAKLAVQECKDTAEGLADSLKRDPKETPVLLTIPYGGTVMQELPDYVVPSKYIPFMTHLLEAGTLLLIQGICHYDIHWNNILLSDQLRIIDFGASWIPSELTKQNVGQLGREFVPTTGHEPFEMTYWNGIKDQDVGLTQEQILRTLFSQKPVLAVMDAVYGIDRQQLEHQFRRFLQTSQAIQTKDSLQFYKSYWTKFDAWSIGWIMLRYLQMGLFNPKFVKETYQPHKKAFLRTIQGLLHMDPAHRWDAAEALAIFAPNSPILTKPAVREWLVKQKQVRDRLSAYESLLGSSA